MQSLEWVDVLKFTTASIASIGAGGALVFSLSSWLGKVWANRIMEGERHQLVMALEKTKRDFDVIKETTLRFQNDKLFTYRAVIEVVSRLLATFDSHQFGRLEVQEAGARFDEFNEQRLRVYGYLAMIAPQAVMDAQDNLMDYLLMIANGNAPYEWVKVREKAIIMLNVIREDVGIDKSPISYNGAL